MNMPSASKLNIVMTCPASSYLPVVIEDRKTGGSADRGTRLHKCIDSLFNDGMSAAIDLAKELDVLNDFTSINQDLFKVDLDDIQTEVAFEYDTFAKDHQVYGRNGYDKFQYGKRIRGVSDLVGYSSGVLVVLDWKTGFGDTPVAGDNWQLIVAALAMRRPSQGAIGRIVNTSTGVVDVAEYTPETLDAKELEIKMFADDLNSGKSKFRYKTGEHCKYCPSWLVCPAQVGAIRRMVAAENSLPVTSDGVINAIDALRKMNDLSVRAEGQIRSYIELVGGRLVDPVSGRVYVPAAADGKIKKERKG